MVKADKMFNVTNMQIKSSAIFHRSLTDVDISFRLSSVFGFPVAIFCCLYQTKLLVSLRVPLTKHAHISATLNVEPDFVAVSDFETPFG